QPTRRRWTRRPSVSSAAPSRSVRVRSVLASGRCSRASVTPWWKAPSSAARTSRNSSQGRSSRPAGASRRGEAAVLPTLPLRLLGGRLTDVPGHDLRIRREPVGGLHELAPLDLPDLHEAASLVVGGGDLHGRYQAAERE